jgi:hypothetical protein
MELKIIGTFVVLILIMIIVFYNYKPAIASQTLMNAYNNALVNNFRSLFQPKIIEGGRGRSPAKIIAQARRYIAQAKQYSAQAKAVSRTFRNSTPSQRRDQIRKLLSRKRPSRQQINNYLNRVQAPANISIPVAGVATLPVVTGPTVNYREEAQNMRKRLSVSIARLKRQFLDARQSIKRQVNRLKRFKKTLGKSITRSARRNRLTRRQKMENLMSEVNNKINEFKILNRELKKRMREISGKYKPVIKSYKTNWTLFETGADPGNDTWKVVYDSISSKMNELANVKIPPIPDSSNIYRKFYSSLVKLLQTNYGLTVITNVNVLFSISRFLRKIRGKNIIDKLEKIKTAVSDGGFDTSNKKDMHSIFTELFVYYNEIRPRYPLRFCKDSAKALVKIGIKTPRSLREEKSKLAKFGFRRFDALLSYKRIFKRLNITMKTPEYDTMLNTYKDFGLNKQTNLKRFLMTCIKFNIKEQKSTKEKKSANKDEPLDNPTSIPFAEFYDIVSANNIKHDNFYKFVYLCMGSSRGGGFFIPTNTKSLQNFVDTVKDFDPNLKMSSGNNLLSRLESFRADLNNAGIYNYKTYTTMISDVTSQVHIDKKDMKKFITIFTDYYNNYKYDPAKEAEKTKFEQKYTILNNKIPETPFNVAIQNYLSTFNASLNFEKNKRMDFGKFIQNMTKEGSIKYMSQLEDAVDPEKTTIKNSQYFLENFAENNANDAMDPYNILMSVYNSVSSLFSSYSSDAYPNKEGYISLLPSFGITDTTAPIQIDKKGTTVIGDKGLFTFISEKYNMKNFDDVTNLIRFCASINMPMLEMDNVLGILTSFGVNAGNFNSFLKAASQLNIGNINAFILVIPKLTKFGVNMSNIENFKNDAVKIGVNIAGSKSTTSDDGANSLLNRLLDILLKYNITYKYSKYDTCNTKFSNFAYNLSSDGINATEFLEIAPTLLSALNIEEELSEAQLANLDPDRCDKNLRDFIIRRSNFFIKPNDTSPYGNSICPNPANEYNYNKVTIDENWDENKTAYKILFDRTNPPNMENSANYFMPNIIEKGVFENKSKKQILKLYSNIKMIRGDDADFENENNNISPENYGWLIDFPNNSQYKKLINSRSISRDDKLSRSFMSCLLAKILIVMDNKSKVGTTPTSLADIDGNIKTYNRYLGPVNMLLLFPHYSLSLLTKYAKTDACNTHRKPNSKTRNLFQGGVFPVIMDENKNAGLFGFDLLSEELNNIVFTE